MTDRVDSLTGLSPGLVLTYGHGAPGLPRSRIVGALLVCAMLGGLIGVIRASLTTTAGATIRCGYRYRAPHYTEPADIASQETWSEQRAVTKLVLLPAGRAAIQKAANGVLPPAQQLAASEMSTNLSAEAIQDLRTIELRFTSYNSAKASAAVTAAATYALSWSKDTDRAGTLVGPIWTEKPSRLFAFCVGSIFGLITAMTAIIVVLGYQRLSWR